MSADCDGVAKGLVQHSSIQSAVKADHSTSIGFSCLDDVVIVEATGKAKGKAGEAATVVQKGATGAPIDLTGLSQEERDEMAPDIILRDDAITPEPQPAGSEGGDSQAQSTTIIHTYRVSSNNMVYWGARTSAGVLIWSSSARVTFWMSLQNTLHPFNASYTSLGKQPRAKMSA